MDRTPRRQLRSIIVLLLAIVALVTTSATALAAAQWKSPVSEFHARQMALLMEKAEHSTYGGVKRFTVSSCTKLTALKYRCVVIASFPGYGGGTLVERTTLVTSWKANSDSLLTSAAATLAHKVTSCPPDVQADVECAASTTKQAWAWDATPGVWVDKS